MWNTLCTFIFFYLKKNPHQIFKLNIIKIVNIDIKPPIYTFIIKNYTNFSIAINKNDFMKIVLV